MKKNLCASNTDVKNTLLKLTRESYFFNNIDYKIILNFLRDGILTIVKRKPGYVVFEQGDTDSRFLYLLLKGEVSIFVNHLKLCTIDKISLIGEISFMNPEIPRSATVICESEAFFIKFDNVFFDKIDVHIQSIIYCNIAREMATRLANSNKIIASQANCSTDEKSTQIVKNTTIDNVITLLGEK